MFSSFIKGQKLYINDRHEEKDTENEDREKLYDKKILSLLERGDVAIFGAKINQFLWDYYRKLGLAKIKKDDIFFVSDFLGYKSLTKALLEDKILLEEFKKRKFDFISPYIESESTRKLAEKINSRLYRDSEITSWFNNKIKYRKLLEDCGLPAISGYKVENKKEIRKAYDKLKKQGFEKVVLKKGRSVAGFGIWKVENIDKLDLNKNEEYLLEGFVEKIFLSPNVQYFIGRDDIKFLTATDQIFGESGFDHKGNIFPSRLEKLPELKQKILNYSQKVCDYLQNKKCFGFVGIDFIITQNQDVYSCECNVRLNSSTFPFFIVSKLFPEQNVSWHSFTLKTQPIEFEDFYRKNKKLFINRIGDYGIFPVDIDLLNSYGEGQFFAVHKTNKKVKELINKIN